MTTFSTNNSNNNCPITIIFGIVSNLYIIDSFISHVTYLVQLYYLGKMSKARNGKLSLKLQILLTLAYNDDVKCKQHGFTILLITSS